MTQGTDSLRRNLVLGVAAAAAQPAVAQTWGFGGGPASGNPAGPAAASPAPGQANQAACPLPAHLRKRQVGEVYALAQCDPSSALKRAFGRHAAEINISPNSNANARKPDVHLGFWQFNCPAWSEARSTVFLFGQGHFSGTENSIVALDLGADEPQWRREFDGSPPSVRQKDWDEQNQPNAQYNTGWHRPSGQSALGDPFGAPISPHGYDSVQIHDGVDQLIVLGLCGVNAQPTGTRSFPNVCAWDLKKHQWLHPQTYPDLPATTAWKGFPMQGLIVKDPLTQRICWGFDRRLHLFDATANQHRVLNAAPDTWWAYGKGAIDPERGRMLVLNVAPGNADNFAPRIVDLMADGRTTPAEIRNLKYHGRTDWCHNLFAAPYLGAGCMVGLFGPLTPEDAVPWRVMRLNRLQDGVYEAQELPLKGAGPAVPFPAGNPEAYRGVAVHAASMRSLFLLFKNGVWGVRLAA